MAPARLVRRAPARFPQGRAYDAARQRLGVRRPSAALVGARIHPTPAKTGLAPARPHRTLLPLQFISYGAAAFPLLAQLCYLVTWLFTPAFPAPSQPRAMLFPTHSLFLARAWQATLRHAHRAPARFRCAGPMTPRASVLECASPLALWSGHGFTRLLRKPVWPRRTRRRPPSAAIHMKSSQRAARRIRAFACGPEDG